MQESLLYHPGLLCDNCGMASADHTYHQVWIEDATRRGCHKDLYLCTKCYKKRKAKGSE